MSLGTVVVGFFYAHNCGGSGFIGKAIIRKLRRSGYDALTISRQPELNSISWTDLESNGLPDCVAVLNVAGQNVLDPKRRWTPGFQQNVYASRVRTTRLLAQEIQKKSNPPKVFGVISGVGFYESRDDVTHTEDSPGGNHDYFSRLCTDWEEASTLPDDFNVRRIVVRSGVVLGRSGGMVQQIYWPFYFGLGGPVGSGNQPFPWIHIEDISGIFLHGITSDSVSGVLNGVAPELSTNAEFSKALARAMWRPSLFPLPEFALNLAFGKERAAMMTTGPKVLPKRTLESGYKFQYPDIKTACKACTSSSDKDSKSN